MPIPRPFKSLLLFMTAISLTGCSISRVVRVEDRQTIDVKVMMAELRDAPLCLPGRFIPPRRTTGFSSTS